MIYEMGVWVGCDLFCEQPCCVQTQVYNWGPRVGSPWEMTVKDSTEDIKIRKDDEVLSKMV